MAFSVTLQNPPSSSLPGPTSEYFGTPRWGMCNLAKFLENYWNIMKSIDKVVKKFL